MHKWDDVGLSFGLDICAKVSVSRGKISKKGDILLDGESNICELINVGEIYEYLGFHKCEGVDTSGSKKLIYRYYLQHLWLAWKSLLSGKSNQLLLCTHVDIWLYYYHMD